MPSRKVFTAFSVSFVFGKTVNYHLGGRVVRNVEMAHNWFGSIFVIYLNTTKLFAEAVSKFSPCFSYV